MLQTMTSRIPLFAAAMLVSLVFSSCGSGKDPAQGKAGKRVPRYAALIAKPEPFLDSRGGIATVSASDQVDLKVEATGRVAEILVREGGPVRKGAVLVRLDDAEARAQRDRAAARARLAAANVSRAREQVRVEAASAQQLETVVADSAVAAAELALAEVALEKTRVRAPFDGVAGLLDVSRGQWVQAGQKLTSFVSKGRFHLDWALPEGDALRVGPGRSLPWKEPVSGRTGVATVAALEPALDEATRTRALRAVCRSGCEALLPGMAVEIRLPVDSTPVLAVPSQALTGSVKGVALFLFKGGKASQVAVVAGRRSTDKVEILSGLAAGDTVLLPGASPPKSGADVEIARMMDDKGGMGRPDGGKSGMGAKGASRP